MRLAFGMEAAKIVREEQRIGDEVNDRTFKSKRDFIRQYRQACERAYGRKFEELTNYERYYALSDLIASIARDEDADEQESGHKRVYYFSLEFLIGPLLDNYLLNLGVHDVVEEAFDELGVPLSDITAQEPDPGLGNGGLGRLAACFMDSMAHENVVGCGIGIHYRFGLFRQGIDEGGRQVELTDNWLAHGYPWETRNSDESVVVRFGGYVQRHEEDGRYWFTQEGGTRVRAVPYDIPIIGYEGCVNNLRLWSVYPYDEKFDLDAFNRGDYCQANREYNEAAAISTILYPNDSTPQGRELRLKQEYLFVAAGLQTILATFEREYGPDWEHLPDHVAIHTNDTHPAIAGPELMRILVDDKHVDFELAFKIAQATCSYTNHTVMPEAMESWDINLFRRLMPRTYMIIEEIDRRYRETFPRQAADWSDRLARTAILWDGKVRMANLSVIFSHSVNGVSALHTQILESTVLRDFYELSPDLFNNKTNGVSHRRFLANANPEYARLITDAIGDGWLGDASELGRLVEFEDDPSFLEGFAKARQDGKERLAAYMRREYNVELDTSTVFDTQVKRMHAYKRQLLNVFKVIDLYNHIVDDPNFDVVPTTFIFSGKAAASYTYAKEVIRLINSVADVVNGDPRCKGRISVCFIPNFAVSKAQLIYAGSDISEQISLAGTEASGTGNMKFMMNGGITLGTYDGANVEIVNLVGEGNAKIFGLRADEVDELRRAGNYYAWDVYNADRDRIGRIVDELTDGTFARLSGDHQVVHDALMVNNDPYLVMRDFYSYADAWRELTEAYADRARWDRAAVHNTACSGYFSSDRTIREYADGIWHVD